MDYIKKGKELRRDTIQMIYEAKSGHPGGSLSMVEILIALYYNVMNIDSKNPNKNDRDLFVLSKGHSCPSYYAILADKGYFPKEDLMTLRKTNSNLQGHPDSHKIIGVDVNTGSLGQGASVSIGLALGAKKKFENKITNRCQNVYVVLGDGELQEGIVWEAAMSASHYKLDNLVFILDNNGLQIDGKNEEVMDIGDVKKKFEAFGFAVFCVDGHNVEEITIALKTKVIGKPKFILAKTVKGKGVSFMENQAGWHGKAPNADEYKKAIEELS